MNRSGYCLSTMLVSMVFSACAGLSQIQHPVSQFDQATHSAATAESAFLDSILMVDCEAQFYENAYNYAHNQGTLKLIGYCTPRVIKPEQIELRKSLMNAIVLYADKMQALASTDDDKQLDTNSQTLAKNLNTLATTGGIKLKDPALVQGVETAFIAIANMALDQKKYKTIREAAQNMQLPLTNVVEALKSENSSLAKDMGDKIKTGKFGLVENQLHIVINESRNKTNDPGETFFNIVNGRNILLSLSQVPKQSFGLSGTKSGDPAKPLNDALDAIVNCNKAIAETKSGGIGAAASDLYQRATAAQDIYKSTASAK